MEETPRQQIKRQIEDHYESHVGPYLKPGHAQTRKEDIAAIGNAFHIETLAWAAGWKINGEGFCEPLYELKDLPCGCQDVYYADGTTDREHDHVECDGEPLDDSEDDDSEGPQKFCGNTRYHHPHYWDDNGRLVECDLVSISLYTHR